MLAAALKLWLHLPWFVTLLGSVHPTLAKSQCWLLWHRGLDQVGKAEAVQLTPEEALLLNHRWWRPCLQSLHELDPPTTLHSWSQQREAVQWEGRFLMTRRRKADTTLKSLRTTGYRKKAQACPRSLLSCLLIPSSLGLTPNVLTHGITCCSGPTALANWFQWVWKMFSYKWRQNFGLGCNRRMTNVLTMSGGHAYEEFILIRDLWPSSLEHIGASPQRGPAFIALRLAFSASWLEPSSAKQATGYLCFPWNPLQMHDSLPRDPKGWGIRDRDALRKGETLIIIESIQWTLVIHQAVS